MRKKFTFKNRLRSIRERGLSWCRSCTLGSVLGPPPHQRVAALRVADAIFPGDARFSGLSYVVLAPQHTKTGDDKCAELRAGWLWPFFRRWVDQSRAVGGARARLFPDAAELRQALAESLAHFDLSGCGFVMHSFCAGGSLYLLTLDVHIDEVLRRGRWRQPESARPYLQRLRALTAYEDIRAPLLRRAARLASAPALHLQMLWPA